MKFSQLVAIVVFAGVSTFASTAYAAENEPARIVNLRVTVVTPAPAPAAALVPKVTRPAILPALYATFGATQAWDIYSTRRALQAGAREANPATAAFSASTGAMIGLKVATTASTIVFAERMWKKNKVAAIIMLAAINGATAAVSVRNMQNAKTGRGAGLSPH